MSLIDAMMDECEIINKSKVSDGEGGFITTWTPGAKIMAAIVMDTSMQAKIAEVQGVKSLYTVTTKKDVMLEYGDVIHRLKDDKIFRVTSNAGDKVSPSVSTLNMAQVSAEIWSLTT